ncbi:MAG TPA: penicillin-binding transpeptidase domain-containing protein [Lacibacter sp.]|nr:penicillin-binding transpeptidase domain-containing protein [Lacibacter sp.]HMO88131.1 penicillin-binding transpeptidase domain-containing protein [Lacibacter sp.]HMP87987.1 penicillin-binding transpeptidase domain-containing protein [Lacibacter sp.]
MNTNPITSFPLRLFLSLLVSVALLQGCSINNIRIDKNLKTYFDQYEATGSFALFDNAQAKFTIYDSAAFRKRYAPASTFKIVNSLIGVETGVISSENMTLPWDGVYRTGPGGDTLHNWNRELTMAEAFRVSAVPYFQEVARRIGRDTLQRYLDTLSYGNKNCSGSIDSFWLNQTLLISPDEQLGLVKRLYFDQLPFQKRTQQLVRKVMLQEDNTLYKLSYKTGWGRDAAGRHTGWVVGWIEENRRPYFFVLLLQADQPGYDMVGRRIALLKTILSHYDFMKGKK